MAHKAYKAVALRAPVVTDEFTIGSFRTKLQRNGVLAGIIRATVQRGHAIRDVNIFMNGSRLERIMPFLKTGETIRLKGKWSQKNTMVAFDLQGDMTVPLHSPALV